MSEQMSFFRDLAGYIVEMESDELACKGSALIPSQKALEQKKQQLTGALTKEYNVFLKKMGSVKTILNRELQELPLQQKEPIARDLLLAVHCLNSNPSLEEVEKKGSWQKYIGITHETMYWIYSIACKAIEETLYEDAYALCNFLVFLNPLVAEHWIRLGIVNQFLAQEDAALLAFMQASSLDQKAWFPKLEIARIYLNQKNYDKAVAELADLDALITEQNLLDVKPEWEILQNQAKNQ